MAKYRIKNLNYIAVGDDRCFINMDTVLGYEIYDYLHLLCAENGTSGYVSIEDKTTLSNFQLLHHDIGTEQGDGYWYPTNYIEKEEDEPLSKETFHEEIILNEKQDVYIETDPDSRKYIRLYLSCCTLEMKEKIRKFNRNREKFGVTYIMDPNANGKNELVCDGQKAFGMYDIRDVSIKDYGRHDAVNGALLSLDLRHEIYAPSMQNHPIGFVQSQADSGYQNDAIVMTQNLVMDPNIIRTSMLSTRNDDMEVQLEYGAAIGSEGGKTYLYAPQSSVSELCSRTQAMTPVRNFNNVRRSYIIDMPVDSIASDYEKGTEFARRMHISKSAYDSQYSMNMSSLSSIDACRQYCGIGICGGQPYLKFYDGTSYMSEGDSLKHGVKEESVAEKTTNFPY